MAQEHLDQLAADASAYWDTNREKANDPAFWMAHPICRAYINRRVTGSPHEWPLDWFKREHVREPFERGVSWGCGLGPFERAARKLGLVKEIDAFDISATSLADARAEAKKAGISGINYQLGDFNNPRLGPDGYDIAFFHASLHHVGALERLFRRLSLALNAGGLIYLDEYVGPSRTEWTEDRLAVGRAILDLLPAEAKITNTLHAPIELTDPSEAIRSSEISTFVKEFCDVVFWRPYGGQIVDLVLPCVRHEWAHSEQGMRAVEAMLRLEDEELRSRPASSHYLVACGRLKSFPRLWRPLGRQVAQAARRRIVGFLDDRLLAGSSS